MRFLLHFNAAYAAEICFAEFDGLLAREGIDRPSVYEPSEASNFPFVVAHFDSEVAARRVLQTAIQVRYYYTIWTHDVWCHSLHQAVEQISKAPAHLIASACSPETSWRIFIAGEHGKISAGTNQNAVREHLAGAVDFQGKVDLSDSAGVTLTILVDFAPPATSPVASHSAAPAGVADPAHSRTYDRSLCASTGLCDCGANEGASDPALSGPPLSRKRDYRVTIGVRHETSRRWVGEMALSRRAYLGPTSLDPELALVMANLGHVTPGSLVLDPFVGTGSLSLASARLGGVTFGTDIDYRVVVLGKQGRDVRSNFMQYGLPQPELVRADNSRPALRPAVPFFDAIVTDPPYGVRAGARKSGLKPPATQQQGDGGASSPVVVVDSPSGNPHFPATQPYDGEEVMIDLLDTAARSLVLGGRLVYLYPCVPQDYSRAQLPAHPCLSLLCDPEERLSRMLSRRIVVMVKTAEYDPARTREYRAAAIAAAQAAGTLGEGCSLKARLCSAYDAWYAEKKAEEPALKSAVATGKRKAAASAGAPETPSSVAPAGSGGAAPSPSVASEPAGSQGASESPLSAGVSRNKLKKELRKLDKLDHRRARLESEAAAAAAGIPAAPKELRPGQIANLRFLEKVAAGLAPLRVGNTKFDAGHRPQPQRAANPTRTPQPELEGQVQESASGTGTSGSAEATSPKLTTS